MNQILHIFRKDVRHHWIEILLCQLALLAFCWNEVRSWSEPDVIDRNRTITEGILFLLPLTWCFFILRIAHDESLAGDRQFWITRPYEWKKLLAEKILVVLVFLNLPLFIAGVILLNQAGFSPIPHIAALLWMQCFMLLFPFIPLLALGSVTRNLVQGGVALLAVWLLVTGLFIFRIGFDAALGGISSGLPFSWSPQDPLLVLFCIAVVVLQYARRKTSWSRTWLASGILVVLMISLASAYARRHGYLSPGPGQQTSGFHADLDPVKLAAPKDPPARNEDVFIGLPLSATGVPSNSLGWVQDSRIVLEAPDGFRWVAHGGGTNWLLRPGENRWRILLMMEYDAYQRLKSAPLKAHVAIAAGIGREHDFEVVTATDGEFAVPNDGRCRMWPRHNSLRCNSPLLTPSMVVLRVDPALSTCAPSDVAPLPMDGVPYSWHMRRDSRLLKYGVSPVASTSFDFYFKRDITRICPGTPLTFSFPQFSERVRSDFDITNFKLEEYRLGLVWMDNDIKGANGIRLGLPPLR